VKVSAPEKTSVYRILKAKAREAEELHNVLIPDESLLKAIQLSERYLMNKNQPDKSIDLVEEASAKLRMILESKPEPLIEVQNEVSDLEIEIEMIHIKHGTDVKNDRAKKSLDKLTKKLAEKKEELQNIQDEYSKQRILLDELIKTKEVLVDFNKEYQEALHLGEFEKAAVISTKDIPKIEEGIQEIEAKLLEHAETVDENLIQNVVTPIMISRIIEDQTGIPVTAQDEDDLEKYREMEVALSKEVHGQEKPIKEISAAIKRSKAGLSDPNKPLGSFLCLGPTGVGKTYLAQKIAEFMFETDKVMHRFDMSEYMEAHSVARLFGSPPGYVGHDEGGQLTEDVKRNPYSIILFDEIEKAHPRVFDTLLQILDAGRMTDGKGETVDFRNTIVIMTSNIGADTIREGLEKGYPFEAIEIAIFDEIKNHFRPEFLNRFDAKVVFNALAPNAIINIAESELGKLADRILQDNDIELHWHQDMAIMVTNNAYDVADGARPIKRFINDMIVNKLTDAILNGEVKHGNSVYIRPNPMNHKDLLLMQVTANELQDLKKEEISELSINSDLIAKTSRTLKVSEDEIVDADLGEPKKKKKKKKKNLMKETFNLKTQAGD
jgi:ATP-dependent Clp protease ATP-binding subunit ClpB